MNQIRPDQLAKQLLRSGWERLSAAQRRVIMTSQNRQASRDPEAAANDYAVNLKAELEIRMLQEKMDLLIEEVRQFRAAPP